jgi:hypothetical protein
VNLRPFANREALLQVAREAMGDWGENDLNAAESLRRCALWRGLKTPGQSGLRSGHSPPAGPAPVAREAMGDWGENDLNAALSAHPRIGEKPSGSQAHATMSRQEQLFAAAPFGAD